MPTTQEQIAIEALREIARYSPELFVSRGLRVVHRALEQIDAINKPTTVHSLSASDCIIDKPPGGGLD